MYVLFPHPASVFIFCFCRRASFNVVKEYDGQRKTDSGMVSVLCYTDVTNGRLWESAL